MQATVFKEIVTRLFSYDLGHLFPGVSQSSQGSGCVGGEEEGGSGGQPRPRNMASSIWDRQDLFYRIQKYDLARVSPNLILCLLTKRRMKTALDSFSKLSASR